MIPAQQHRTVEATGALSEGLFGISFEDQSHIISILRDRLYTNKVLAVLREYSTNAWDAHVEAGLRDTPIKIALPTRYESSLVVRDYGPGLSEDDIYNVFAKYGKSTKRLSNDLVGTLGIGAKSGFAYNNSFTVTTYHGGKKMVFVCALDESNVGKITKMWEGDTEETGIEIKIPVRPGDEWMFNREAEWLYTFFKPRPNINLDIEHVELEYENQFGYFSKKPPRDGLPLLVGVMGCVPYKIDGARLNAELIQRDIKSLPNVYMGMYFNIGEVDVSANREELEYTDRTRKAIVDRLFDLIDSYRAQVLETLRSTPLGLTRRQSLLSYLQETGLPCPEEYKHLKGTEVRLYDYWLPPKPLDDLFGGLLSDKKPAAEAESAEDTLVALAEMGVTVADDEKADPNNKKEVDRESLPSRRHKRVWHPGGDGTEPVVITTFYLAHMAVNYGRRQKKRAWMKEANSLPVSATLVIKDDTRPLRHFDFREGGNQRGPYFFIVPRVPLDTPEAVKAMMDELNDVLVAASMDGIEIRRLSSFRYIAPDPSEAPPSVEAYKKNVFKLKGATRHSRRNSDLWEPLTTLPTKNDFFLRLHRFEVQGHRLDAILRRLTWLNRTFGFPVPTIYGVKVSEAGELKRKLDAKPWEQWWQEKAQEAAALRPDIIEYLRIRLIDQDQSAQLEFLAKASARLRKNLGRHHPLTKLANEAASRRKFIQERQHLEDDRSFMELFGEFPVGDKPDFGPRIEQLAKEYPLLFGGTKGTAGLLVLTFDDREDRLPWYDYIRATDCFNNEDDNAQLPADREDGEQHHGDRGGEEPYGSEGGEELPSPGEGDLGTGLGLGSELLLSGEPAEELV
jgi:hypothetical protein